MQATVFVQPLSAMAATNSPKPFSSAAVHSVLVMRQAALCASATVDPTVKNPAADATNATAKDARTGNPRCKSTFEWKRNLAEAKPLRHDCWRSPVHIPSLSVAYDENETGSKSPSG